LNSFTAPCVPATVVVNLDIASPEENPATPQPDPFHSAPGKF
jgi:hypothetical protein